MRSLPDVEFNSDVLQWSSGPARTHRDRFALALTYSSLWTAPWLHLTLDSLQSRERSVPTEGSDSPVFVTVSENVFLLVYTIATQRVMMCFVAFLHPSKQQTSRRL